MVVFSRLQLRKSDNSLLLKQIGKRLSEPVAHFESTVDSNSVYQEELQSNLKHQSLCKSASSHLTSLSLDDGLRKDQTPSRLQPKISEHREKTHQRPYHPFEINNIHKRYAHSPNTLPTGPGAATSGFLMNNDTANRAIQNGFGLKQKSASPIIPFTSKSKSLDSIPDWARLKDKGMKFNEARFKAAPVSPFLNPIVDLFCFRPQRD